MKKTKNFYSIFNEKLELLRSEVKNVPKAKFIAKDKDKKSDRMKAAKGGRAGYKSGKTVKKKSSRKALRGSGCEIR